MDHYAKIILFSDCVSRELPKGRYQTSYLNLHNGHAVIWFKFFFLNTHVYQS